MPHYTHYFDDPVTVQWLWPVQVGILDQSHPELHPEILQQYHWAQELSSVHYLSEIRRSSNLLISTKGFNATAGELLKYSGRPIRTDAIIIPESADFINDLGPVTEGALQAVLSSMIEVTGAIGIFIIALPDDLPIWYNNLIEGLSHDLHLRDAIEMVTPDVFSYLSPLLEERTRLSVYTKSLLVELYELNQLKSIEIQSKFTGGAPVSSREFIAFLTQNIPYFSYDHESDTSDDIAGVSEQVLHHIPIENFRSSASEADLDQYIITNIVGDGQELTGSEGVDPGLEIFGPEDADPGSPDPQATPDPGLEIFVPETGDPGPGPTPPKVVAPGSTDPQATPDPGDSGSPDPQTTADPGQARYLQARVLDPNAAPSPQDTVLYLLPDRDYNLYARIGYYDTIWMQGGRSAPTERIFRDSQEDIEPIRLVFKHNFSEDLQEATIFIPRTGNSTKATFRFTTRSAGESFEGTLFAYHQNRMIQSATIYGSVITASTEVSSVPPLEMDVSRPARTDFTDFRERSSFSSSIYFDDQNGVLGVSAEKAVNLNMQDALKNNVQGIRRAIEEAVRNIDDYPEDLTHENNVFLLTKLALNGRLIFDNFLKGKMDFAGPIQIVAQSTNFVPLDFVYTYPSPKEDAELCPGAVEGLQNGNCENCRVDQEADKSDYVCPFGFLGFSKIIERHALIPKSASIAHYDYQLTSEPVGQRKLLPVLRKTIFSSATRVERASAGLIDRVAAKIRSISATTVQVDNWEDWQSEVDTTRPDCLILLVHTEENKDFGIMQMEIGDGQFKLQPYINESVIYSKSGTEKPLVILIGCNTTDVEEAGFDFTSQFINKGAPVVLSNFTKIRGRQAGPIVIQLLDFIRQNVDRTWTLGEIMLRLRQHLLSQGIMVSLALTTYGDADWQLTL